MIFKTREYQWHFPSGFANKETGEHMEGHIHFKITLPEPLLINGAVEAQCQIILFNTMFNPNMRRRGVDVFAITNQSRPEDLNKVFIEGEKFTQLENGVSISPEFSLVFAPEHFQRGGTQLALFSAMTAGVMAGVTTESRHRVNLRLPADVMGSGDAPMGQRIHAIGNGITFPPRPDRGLGYSFVEALTDLPLTITDPTPMSFLLKGALDAADDALRSYYVAIDPNLHAGDRGIILDFGEGQAGSFESTVIIDPKTLTPGVHRLIAQVHTEEEGNSGVAMNWMEYFETA